MAEIKEQQEQQEEMSILYAEAAEDAKMGVSDDELLSELNQIVSTEVKAD